MRAKHFVDRKLRDVPLFFLTNLAAVVGRDYEREEREIKEKEQQMMMGMVVGMKQNIDDMMELQQNTANGGDTLHDGLSVLIQQGDPCSFALPVSGPLLLEPS